MTRKIRIHWPITADSLSLLVAGKTDVFDAASELGPVIEMLRVTPKLGNFSPYTQVFEAGIGFEGFTAGPLARPTLGAAGQRTLSPTIVITTYLDEDTDESEVMTILDHLADLHPWEVPVIELSAPIHLILPRSPVNGIVSSTAASLAESRVTSAPTASDLWSRFSEILNGRTFTDLTHAFHPGQPRFPSFPDETREALFDLDKGDGFTVHRYSIVGQWGTHIDPPSHFIKGGRSLDQIPVTEMVLPLVVLDISDRASRDADATPTMDDVIAWEQKYGTIPEGSFVALRTDWHLRWPNTERMANRGSDEVSHCPGWSQEVLTFLVEERKITAIGHEQTDTDPGMATSRSDYSLETYLLSQDCWQIELLSHLNDVPESGALILAMWPKPHQGSGFPARVVAIH